MGLIQLIEFYNWFAFKFQISNAVKGDKEQLGERLTIYAL